MTLHKAATYPQGGIPRRSIAIGARQKAEKALRDEKTGTFAHIVTRMKSLGINKKTQGEILTKPGRRATAKR